jgi:hypothetical protein
LKRYCIESTHKDEDRGTLAGVLVTVQTPDQDLFADDLARGFRDRLFAAAQASAGGSLVTLHARAFDVPATEHRPHAVHLSANEANQLMDLLREAENPKSGWSADVRKMYREIRRQVWDMHVPIAKEARAS